MNFITLAHRLEKEINHFNWKLEKVIHCCFYFGIHLFICSFYKKKCFNIDLTCINSRSVSMDVKIEPATPYWLVPQTYAPDLLGKFTVSVYVHDPEGEVWVKPL